MSILVVSLEPPAGILLRTVILSSRLPKTAFIGILQVDDTRLTRVTLARLLETVS